MCHLTFSTLADSLRHANKILLTGFSRNKSMIRGGGPGVCEGPEATWSHVEPCFGEVLGHQSQKSCYS